MFWFRPALYNTVTYLQYTLLAKPILQNNSVLSKRGLGGNIQDERSDSRTVPLFLTVGWRGGGGTALLILISTALNLVLAVMA